MILQYLRGGKHSRFLTTVLFGFILLAVGGMVFMDVGGFFRSGVGNTDVAEVGRTSISAQSFDRLLGTVLARQGMSRQDAFRMGLVQQVLSGEIRDSLLMQQAGALGISVSDRLVASRIESLIPPQEGMTKQQALDMVLRNQGMSEAEFVRMIRREMTTSTVRNAFSAGKGWIPDALARDLFAWDQEARSVDLVFLPDEAPGQSVPPPSEEALKKFYEASRPVYTVPETRSLSLGILAPDSVKKGIEVPESDLRAAYDADPERWKAAEQRTLEHAVVKDPAQAKALVEKVRGGMSLEKAVQSVTGKKEAYNPPQAFPRDGLPADMAGPVFEARVGDVVGPLSSPLGQHVIVLTKIDPERVRPFEEIKDTLTQEKVDSIAAEKLSEIGNALDDRLAGGAALEEVAQDFTMSIEKIGPIDTQGLTTDGADGLKAFDADRASLMETAFTLAEGETSPVSELSDGRYAVIRVDSLSPETVKPFESVRADLEKRWMTREKILLNTKRAEALFSEVSDGKKDWAEAVGKLGLKSQSVKGLIRSGTPSAPLSVPAFMQIFDTPRDGFFMAQTEGGRVVGRVTSIAPGKLPEGQAGQAALKSGSAAHARELAEIDYGVYLDHLARLYGVQVNEKLLQSLYGAGEEEPQP